jgi:hypothetical protein
VNPIRLASVMMCSSIIDAIPLRWRAARVRIDFTSACRASSRFSAPQPTTVPPSMTDQNVIPGPRSMSRSRACLLSGGVIDSICLTCSSRKLAICGPVRSSTTISTRSA